MLSLNVPKEYKDFINKYGLISKNGVEIYGFMDSINNDSLPSVIAATNLYKKDYKLKEDEIVISFDDFLNCPVVLDRDNIVYNIYLDKKEKIASSFNEWFIQIINEYELDINE